MRLAVKIFLTSAVVVAVLAAVGYLSLRAVGRLVTVNREIADQAIPAVRLASSLRDVMRSLSRHEAHYVIHQDRSLPAPRSSSVWRPDTRYATRWYEGAALFEAKLAELASAMTSDRQREALATVAAAFGAYREVVADEHELMGRGRRDQRDQAWQLVEGEGAVRAERVDTALEHLLGETDATTRAALREAARLERRTWRGVLVGLGAAACLALAGSGIVAFRMTRSLRRLSVATRAVADGSFSAPIAVRARDEVGDLARSFNTMAHQLRQVDEMKEDFFATISHDLKSPLGSISEAAYLLREGVTGSLSERQARLVGIIGASADRILGLVNRLLDLSRLRSGVLPLQSLPVNLVQLVERVLEELRPQAETAGVGLVSERIGGDFVVEGDEERLGEVVVNLAINALRFTPKSGEVRVRLRDEGAKVLLEVEDTGVGIPAAALPGIFERYRQVRRDRGGSGLGLAIVRGVVDAHGGRVTVQSLEGKGTCFTVSLPRTRPVV
jgi:signal transduction histidine kinase